MSKQNNGEISKMFVYAGNESPGIGNNSWTILFSFLPAASIQEYQNSGFLYIERKNDDTIESAPSKIEACFGLR